MIVPAHPPVPSSGSFGPRLFSNNAIASHKLFYLTLREAFERKVEAYHRLSCLFLMRSQECGHADPHQSALLRNSDQVSMKREYLMRNCAGQLSYERLAVDAYFTSEMANWRNAFCVGLEFIASTSNASTSNKVELRCRTGATALQVRRSSEQKNAFPNSQRIASIGGEGQPIPRRDCRGQNCVLPQFPLGLCEGSRFKTRQKFSSCK